MKVYKIETVTREVQRLVKHYCDICGRETRHLDWATGSYDIKETEIRLREGSSYPEGGSGTSIEVDICPTCFREKLLPWLETQGVQVQETEWDY